MKIILLLLLSTFTVFQLHAQKLAAKDSLTIVSAIEDWDKGWRIKDHALASKNYSDDARFTNAFGDNRYGRVEIDALLKQVFGLAFVMAGNSETTSHRFQSLNDVVPVHTSVIRKGQKLPDGTTLADRQTTHLRIFQQQASSWLIVAHLISDARDKQVPKH